MDPSPQTFVLTFGAFELRRAQRLLLESGKPVRLGSRALDLLCVLAERAGDLVSHDELMKRVWPRTIVEESNLRVHVSALRRVLGEGRKGVQFISNVPGRGYTFVAPVRKVHELAPHLKSTPATPPERERKLPLCLKPVVGRDDTVASLSSQLSRRRFISIVGPGGIGKTTVALAMAHERAQHYEHGAWFVDLAALSDPVVVVPAALGAVLGITLPSDASWPDLVEFLRGRRMLIVFDNCAHVVDLAARLVERLLVGAPSVDIIATSLEALNVDGEWVHRLAPFDTPDPSEMPDLRQALELPAVALFVERVNANGFDFELSERNLTFVMQLCRQLDGIPLAIELAAVRAGTLGLQRLTNRLDTVFHSVAGTFRNAPPRHRDLQALLDWSHDLLTESERVVLRRLSVFPASFTIESAVRVAAVSGEKHTEIVDQLSSLCAKSFLSVDPGEEAYRFRMHNTTRRYAEDRLLASGEAQVVSQQHAGYVLDLIDAGRPYRDDAPMADRMAAYRHIVEDLRAAMTWSLSNDNGDNIGSRLKAAAEELFADIEWLEPGVENVR